MTVPTDPTVAAELRSRFGTAITIGEDCDLTADLCVEIDDDAILVLGDRVSIRRGTTIQAHCGSHVRIGDDVAIGEHVFISAMVGVIIGDGVGISNMVDMHDHNHRERSTVHLPDATLTPWASGFAAAPIVIETGAVISNKATIAAGCRVGQNTIIGANATVTRSIGPNTIAAGSPAHPIRTFDGMLSPAEDRATLHLAWFGTSIMEHLEAYNTRMSTQADLPPVGTGVTVEGWRKRGYVQQLHLGIQADWPHVDVTVDNHGEGGATSRDITTTVATHTRVDSPRIDLAFLGCGINDVWRGHQGRTAEAVDPSEYERNYRQMLSRLSGHARRVICIGETPVGWDPAVDVAAMNTDIVAYNTIAARVAAEAGVAFIDVWPTFVRTAGILRAGTSGTGGQLWSDGVHLSELGDTLMLHRVQLHLRETGIIADLMRYDLHERDDARRRYRYLFESPAAQGKPATAAG